MARKEQIDLVSINFTNSFVYLVQIKKEHLIDVDPTSIITPFGTRIWYCFCLVQLNKGTPV